MTSEKPKLASHMTAADSTSAVDEFMRTLEHPFKQEIEAIRRAMLGVDSTIAEGIKWNAPGFRTSDYFATTNLREKKGIGIILHLGAKVRNLPLGGIVIADPAKLLKWLAKDRAMMAFENLQDFNARKAAFERIVLQWIVHV